MKKLSKEQVLSLRPEETVFLILSDFRTTRTTNGSMYDIWLGLALDWIRLSYFKKLWWAVTNKWQKELKKRLS